MLFNMPVFHGPAGGIGIADPLSALHFAQLSVFFAGLQLPAGMPVLYEAGCGGLASRTM
jgi:hypothetical protein